MTRLIIFTVAVVAAPAVVGANSASALIAFSGRRVLRVIMPASSDFMSWPW